jgi:pyridoxine 5-phosphate synthase
MRGESMPLLGVNIDHVATVRQQRRESEPDPVQAALVCEASGADSIVAHLREDRRHIQDKDILLLKKQLHVPLNLEMSVAPDVVALACRVKPSQATLVPERRQELTTEGGLDVRRHKRVLKTVCQKLLDKGILVSLFIDPEKGQIEACHDIGVTVIELHTGCYAAAQGKLSQKKELIKISSMTAYASGLGLTVNAGHGLKYDNTKPVAQIPGMHELNIGHSIVARALCVGLAQAVKEMRLCCGRA